MKSIWSAVALLALFTGCAGGSETRGSSTSELDPQALETCTAGFTRARECTSDYIPALVDLRVRLNVPAGIADEAQKLGRPGLIEEAMGEWANDSTDEAIAVTCQRMVSGPRARIAAYLDGARGCLAMDGCQAYVDCVMPLHEASFTAK